MSVHSSSRFFQAPSRRQGQFVELGHDEDAPFRALAAGLLNNILTCSAIRSDLLRTLFSRHWTDCPLPALRGFVTASEINTWVHTHGLDRLLPALTTRLRQCAVEAWSASCQASPLDLTLMPVGQAIMPVLAQALNVFISVQTIEPPHKVLPLTVRHNPSAECSFTNPSVVIRVEGPCFHARVSEPDRFKSMNVASVAPTTSMMSPVF